MADVSFIHYFLQASFIVKLVMLTLLASSIFSWTYIIQKYRLLREIKAELSLFKQEYHSGLDMAELYSRCQAGRKHGLYHVFQSGFQEFIRLTRTPGISNGFLQEQIERQMRVASAQELMQVEDNLQFIGTVGSVSPYIGLFGTVWGIMNSMSALSKTSHATITMVAPGIAEALVATALGLLAAIPAVIAHHHFSSEINQLDHEYEVFYELFSGSIIRQYEIEKAMKVSAPEIEEALA